MLSNHIASTLLTAALAVTTASAQEPELSVDLGDGVKLELVLVKKGTFVQGSPANELGRGDDETQRQVTISRDFYLGRYPVTRGQFDRFVREAGYRTESERGTSGGFGFDGREFVQRKEFNWRSPGFEQTDDHPITLVTCDDAQAFITWLARKSSRKFDLPTEAQWEFACRAGSATAFYNGDDGHDIGEIAWFKANAGKGTRPVGRKKPNALGIHDMCGSVYEWCRDWYGPYEPGPVADPEETRSNLSDKPRRVLRGGSWFKDSQYCRSAARYRNTPGSRNADNGFRVVAVVQAQAATGATSANAAASQPAVKDANKTVQGASSRDLAPPPSSLPSVAPPVATSPRVPDQSSNKATSIPAQVSPVRAPSSASTLSWLCLGLLAAGAVAVVVMIVRRLSRPRLYEDSSAPSTFSAVEPASPLLTSPARIVADGFWLDVAHLAVDSIVYYRCMVAGQEQSGQVRVEAAPQGQFVYTGQTPSQVEIVDVVAAQGTSRLGLGGSTRRSSGISPMPPRQPTRTPTPTSRPSTGYPSAY